MKVVMSKLFEPSVVGAKAALQQWERLSDQVHGRLEKLLRLNMSFCREMLNENGAHVSATMVANEATQALALHMGQCQALTVKSAVYLQELLKLQVSAGSELIHALANELVESGNVGSELLKSIIDNAPLGAEGSIQDFKKDIDGLRRLIA
jgi:hypothetical protein